LSLLKIEDKPVEDDKVSCTITEEATRLKATIDTTGFVFSEPFIFKINNFSKAMKSKVPSPSFNIGNYIWGLNVIIENDVFVYLNIQNFDSIPQGHSLFAKFQVSIVDQIDNTDTITKSGAHRFAKMSPDFGFSLTEMSKLRIKRNRYLVNDSLVVSVCINVSQDVDNKSAI